MNEERPSADHNETQGEREPDRVETGQRTAGPGRPRIEDPETLWGDDGELDRAITVTVDCEWPLAPLRCPRCGNRGDSVGQFWARTWVELDPDSAQPLVIMPPRRDDTTLECGNCEHHGPLSTFMPSWQDTPPALTSADRRLEAAWLAREAMLDGES